MIFATTLWLLGSILMYYAERDNPAEGRIYPAAGGRESHVRLPGLVNVYV